MIDIIGLVLLWVLIVMDSIYIRASRRLAKDIELSKGQWLRPVKTVHGAPSA